MSGFGRGLAFMREQREQAPTSFNNGMPRLWLKENEVAKFYFVNDADEIISPLIHNIKKISRQGKEYAKDVLCARRSFGDTTTECTYCATDNPTLRACAIAWVEVILHASPPQKDGQNWQMVSRGGKAFYQENVNGYRLFEIKTKLQDQLESYISFGDDPFAENTGAVIENSLLEVPFTLTRTGSGTSTSYTLKALPKTDIPAEVVVARQSAPALEQTVNEVYGDGKPRTVAAGTRETNVIVEDGDDDLESIFSAGGSDEEEVGF